MDEMRLTDVDTKFDLDLIDAIAGAMKIMKPKVDAREGLYAVLPDGTVRTPTDADLKLLRRDVIHVAAIIGDWEVGVSCPDGVLDHYYSRVMTPIGPTPWKYIESGDGSILDDVLIRVAVLTEEVARLEAMF